MDKHLRALWHDYTRRCIYMVTLKKGLSVEDFGFLEGDYRIPVGVYGCSFIRASRVGRAIKTVLWKFSEIIEPKIRILQYALMPDHIHILLSVTEPTQEILGRIIARFKVAVNNEAGIDGVFAKGFNDQILKHSRSLDTLYRYLKDNPRRLAVRREHPEFFRRVNRLKIGDAYYLAYGNFQLLECPFKEQVLVHRADSEEARSTNRDRWLYTAANGGVLVSPFISPAEKAVRDEAEEAGGNIILVTNEAMGERYKPTGHNFALCEDGRLLIVSAGIGGDVSRAACLAMNTLSASICQESR